ncbi:MAG: glycosyltransferase family 4 protein, partial [Clostridia bacterium]|nr:glycosyltransferase family 4 protein [Clostridia bacterium]
IATVEMLFREHWPTSASVYLPHGEVPAILRGFDLFCAPSICDSESFGVAAVEAMACGVPVVVSNADGFREVVVDGKTGFIVPKRDFATLANKMFLLARDPALRRAMGDEGRLHVLANYRWADNVLMMEDALTETALKCKYKKITDGGPV